LVHARTDFYAGLHAVADLELLRALDHCRDKLVVDRLLDNRTACGRALLACREERSIDYIFHGRIEIGIAQDDRGILAAHFELDPQSPLRGLAVEPVTDLARTGERDGFQRACLYQRIAQLTAGTGHEVHDAFGNTRLVESFNETPCAQRSGGRGLQD